MSRLADILEAESATVVHTWTSRLAQLPETPRATASGLRDHIPALLQELTIALRTGINPQELTVARAHGIQREKLGFDLELLVREYGLLRDVIFDLIEEYGLELELRDVRIITGLMTRASASSVEAYVRRQENEHRERTTLEELAATTRSQQAQLQEVLDALPVLVSFVTADERYALVNKAYEGWFELPREAVVGRHIVEVIGEAAYAQLSPFVKRALAGERFDFDQHDVPYRHGGKRDVRVSFIPRTDSHGAVSGYVALLTDVTDERHNSDERDRLLRAERDAHARTEFLLSVAAAIGERVDPAGVLQRLVDVVVPARGNLAAVWARAPDGAFVREVHSPFHVSLAGDASNRVISGPLARVGETGQTLLVRDFEAWSRAEGVPNAWEVARLLGTRAALFVPIRHGSEIVAVLAIARSEGDAFSHADVELFETAADLTAIALDNARLFEETERLRRTAEEATNEKDRFLAHVSHDLRNPLGSILGWSSLLRGTTNLKQIERGIEVIERNAQAQVQLIDDLLDVSRIASGKLALHLAIEDVRVAVDTALDPARLTAQAKGVTLVVDIADDVGTAIVDPDRFRQIVWNLASNAVKFTPAGGTVRVTVSRVESTLRVVVADTGCGIDPAFLPRIFERFAQAAADSQRSGGLGLGLAIVRRLVELHGGTITVASVLGEGATFTVVLPVRSSARPPATEGPSATRRLDNTHILVVEDQEDSRVLVALLLEAEGATVTMAASADEAMSLFLRARPDAVVSDIGMPVKDGRRLLREIRALPEERGRVPAVALTAFVQPRDRAEALAAGFDEHLSKPIDGPRLVETLVALLERRRSEIRPS